MKIKDDILRMAFRLFVERGFLEVYTTDIIKEFSIDKNVFYHYFKSKDQLIFEIIEKYWYPHFNDIIRTADEYNESSKKKLLKIFRKYSETENYLKSKLKVDRFNYGAIIFLTVEGLKIYEDSTTMTNQIVDFNNRLIEKIEAVIEEGKRLGEILGTVNSKSIALDTVSSLQNALALWVMYENIDIKVLFETNFKYLWNAIKSPEIDDTIIKKCISNF